MPTPQFEGIIVGTGFDKDATPPWQMVAFDPTKSTFSHWREKMVILRFGAGMDVVPQNPRIVTITEDMTLSVGDQRAFLITGASPGIPGNTFIDVFDPKSKKLFSRRLEVDVKENKRYKIAYHFVDKTTYNPTLISNEMHTNLNELYGSQTHVTFENIRAAPLMISPTLFSIVGELKRGGRNNPHREWANLIDWGDPGADINVFFMPWDGRDDERPTEMLALPDWDKLKINIVCPDGMLLAEIERGLAHEIGRFMGCDVTHNEKQKNHLMFRSSFDKGDLSKFVQSGDHLTFASRDLSRSRFISKDCANIMNPTYP